MSVGRDAAGMRVRNRDELLSHPVVVFPATRKEYLTRVTLLSTFYPLLP